MTNITYNSSLGLISLSGEVNESFAITDLTVAIDGQEVTLTQGATTVSLYFTRVKGTRGEKFASVQSLSLYFEYLKEGGEMATLTQVVDITIDRDNNRATFQGVTYDIGSLRAKVDNNNRTDIGTLRICQGSTILLKGINPSKVTINGNRVTMGLHALVDSLNGYFQWAYTTDSSTSSTESVDRFGYAFTGGFAGKPSDNNYVWENGTAISLAANEYTHMQFDSTVQAAVDAPYWGSPVPTGDGAHIGTDVFEGIHLPDGVTQLFDYDYVWADGGVGRIDVSGAQPGDLLRVRMDYNVIPSIANSVIEAALDFSTRDIDDNVTFQFYLTANPSTFGNTSAGQTYLLRTEMTAYFASNEDVNALIRPVIRCNNICQVQPLSILAILQK